MEVDEENPLVTHLKAVIDVESPDFAKNVRELADIVGMESVHHPDPAVLLCGVLTYLENLFDHNDATERDRRDKLVLKDLPLGVPSTGKPDMDNVLKQMRLLNINQLRQLQTDVNVLTVKVQEITADPQTDLHLGKMGR